jgi:type IV secretory pathway TraG/TraD family ATPase VirD4
MSLAHLRSPAEKTTATIKLILNKGLSFLGDPELAASVIPHGPEFDIAEWLASNGTLYMIASGSEESPTAPVFAALATEVFFQSLMIGRAMPGQRLDAPIRFALDELCTICPVPVAEWMSDAGGSGATFALGCHSDDQLKMKFGAEATGAIHGCAGTQILFPGITDAKMLETASKICGDFMQRARGSEHVTNHPIFSESMIRQIPDQFALVIKGNCSPVLAKVERGWRQRPYRQLRRRGQAVAAVEPVSGRAAVEAASEYLAVESPVDDIDVMGDLLADAVAEAHPWGAS